MSFAIPVTTRSPEAGSVTISDIVVANATAGAVGGGIAVRAARLVEAPGSRTVDLLRLGVFNCTAKRGGGMAWLRRVVSWADLFWREECV